MGTASLQIDNYAASGQRPQPRKRLAGLCITDGSASGGLGRGVKGIMLCATLFCLPANRGGEAATTLRDYTSDVSCHETGS